MNDLQYEKPEPEMYEKDYLKLGVKFETREHIGWRLEKERYDRFNSISKEKREEILRLFKTGITIGEVAKTLNLNSDVVWDVVGLNITSVSILRDESL